MGEVTIVLLFLRQLKIGHQTVVVTIHSSNVLDSTVTTG
jgi:hypothetical protein